MVIFFAGSGTSGEVHYGFPYLQTATKICLNR